ncbi:UNVERIFIED_CONTAM: hypothetical protein Sangu_2698500 [Sesamum angustifolium]|uniref:Uncharacterized protein n=1 Tax=Sesamum angustifolium TaxID=2727405 RepID=A0AAW2IZ60_9LAMI
MVTEFDSFVGGSKLTTTFKCISPFGFAIFEPTFLCYMIGSTTIGAVMRVGRSIGASARSPRPQEEPQPRPQTTMAEDSVVVLDEGLEEPTESIG